MDAGIPTHHAQAWFRSVPDAEGRREGGGRSAGPSGTQFVSTHFCLSELSRLRRKSS